MTAKIRVSTVTPFQIPQKNNYVNKRRNIIDQLKPIICLTAFVGINRMYLLSDRKPLQWMSHIYSLILVTLLLYFMTANDRETATMVVFRNTAYIEYSVLVLSSIFFQKKSLERLFKNLHDYDTKLNIDDDVPLTTPMKVCLYWLMGNFFYSVGEYVLLSSFINIRFDFSVSFIYFLVITQDCETIFFCTLLCAVLRRLQVLRAHVSSMFCTDKGDHFSNNLSHLNYIHRLSKKVRLDISSLHNAYELLHKCSEQLNSIMNLPMIVMLFASGLSTTLILKNVFKLSSDGSSTVVQAMIIYAVGRSLKCIVLVTLPCYYSNMTTTQVTIIRMTLYDAINVLELDKFERRRIKAFVLLTRDNEFAYALWGVIRLNMCLPLSYSSLCTTYLVIIIQFSKFID